MENFEIFDNFLGDDVRRRKVGGSHENGAGILLDMSTPKKQNPLR